MIQAVKHGLFAVALGLLVMPLAAQSARADNVDFDCNVATCSGTVAAAAGDTYTTGAGITVFNNSGPYSSTVPFDLSFDTTAGTIALTGTGSLTGQVLQGTINTAVGPISGTTSSDLSLFATWWGLPSAVQSFLGTPTGIDSAFVIYLTDGGAASSVDVLITPTPEPGTLLLFGTGMLLCAGLLRRRRHVLA
ncbi:MAG TPA: PEP-CTERM sorting domain-containing protein [Candidatus Acidoferrales bacterium]|nr:PEP-CTERM sorting domain-containing protein [Candidatus Acidoferrales bacterium]